MAEVECMRDEERHNVVRVIDDESVVPLDAQRVFADEPGVSRGRMATRGIMLISDEVFNCVQTRAKQWFGGVVIRRYDEGGAETMSTHASGIILEDSIDYRTCVSAMGEHEFDRPVAQPLRGSVDAADVGTTLGFTRRCERSARSGARRRR
jgi:hypothetical protein